MTQRNDWYSRDALEDLDTMVEVLQGIALKDGTEVIDLDQDTRWRLEDALDRAKARERAQGKPFSKRDINASFRTDEHKNLMYQSY